MICLKYHLLCPYRFLFNWPSFPQFGLGPTK